MHRFKSAVVGLSVLIGFGVGTTSLAAQSWQGALALGIEVHNDQKQPVPGARVTAEFAEVEPYDGPETVTTDDGGRAVLYGLAEGLWRVQVEREGYSRYLAVVRLDANKKKVVITAGPLRDATAPPLTVDYSKTEATRVAPRPQQRRERDRRPERRREAGEEPPEEPTEEPRPRAEPERRVEPEPPAPPPRPEPEPAPEPAEPAPAEPEPAPAPSEPAEAPPTEPAPETEPEPAPEPESGTFEKSPAPAPEPEPAMPPPESASEMETPPPQTPPEPGAAPPEPEAQSTLPPSPVRSTAHGTCSDCKPGEAAVSARFRAASRAPGQGCPPEVEETIREAVEILAAAPTPEAEDYVGPLVDGGRVLPWAEPTAVAEAQRLLEPWLTPGAACQVALVVLSPDVKFTGYRYQAADAQAGGDCLAGQDCPIGEALWRDHPGIERTDAGTFIYSVFENRSSGWERRGEMTVYFQP